MSTCVLVFTSPTILKIVIDHTQIVPIPSTFGSRITVSQNFVIQDVFDDIVGTDVIQGIGSGKHAIIGIGILAQLLFAREIIFGSHRILWNQVQIGTTHQSSPGQRTEYI